MSQWGTPVEIERRIRIRLSLWAYAYEIKNAPLVSDGLFDAYAYCSNKEIITGRFDAWWKMFFTPYTGSWIHTHPDLIGVERLYQRLCK